MDTTKNGHDLKKMDTKWTRNGHGMDTNRIWPAREQLRPFLINVKNGHEMDTIAVSSQRDARF